MKSCFGQADFAVVLCPCFKSPNDDNGYDISDYRDYIRSCSLWFLFRGRMCIIENGK
uniref:alpha-amylase family glycosyl hydrolase n=1 Tax=Blautia faecicola TaxID=2509240 RepID=UPI0038B8D8B8